MKSNQSIRQEKKKHNQNKRKNNNLIQKIKQIESMVIGN